MTTVDVATPADMRRLGEQIATVLRPGDLVVLTGELGAGKTTLVQGLGAGLGVRAPVLSPTFVISRIHRDGRIPLVHVDAYRLGSVAELDDLDLDADLDEAVTVVEWGEGLVERLSPDRLEVHITLAGAGAGAGAGADETRQVRLAGIGDRWHGVAISP